MKLLHVADLHLGKQLNNFSLLEDQRVILDQIVKIARDANVDAVLVAGDVYQNAAPTAEAMALFDRFVTELIGQKRKVFVISGNHDSRQRVSYFSGLVRDAGLYLSEKYEGTLQSVLLRDDYGDIAIHLLPFMKPAGIKKYYPQEKIVTSEDAAQAIIKASPVNKRMRNVLLVHQFITGGQQSDSEEFMAGGLDSIRWDTFDDFDYVALGHLHRPQHIGRDTLCYAGSPLKYSFSEIDHDKSVTLLELKEKGDISIEKIPLRPMRDLRHVTGRLRDILAMPYSTDYVWVTVTDELTPPDARIDIIASVFPNMMRFSVQNQYIQTDEEILADEQIRSASPVDLFNDFYRQQHGGSAPDDAQTSLMRRVLEELEEEKHEEH